MVDKNAAKVRKFTVEVEAGDEKKVLELMVKKPDQTQLRHANLVYNRVFRDAVKPEDGGKGALVRAALESVLREQKLWDDDKAKRFEELRKSIDRGEQRLAKGGIKLSEGREIALQMRRDRFELQQLTADRNALDLNTAEAQAENAKFNFLVAACTTDQRTGARYFKDVEDYEARADDPVAGEAAAKFANLFYGLEEDFAQRLPESRWLRAYGYTREDGKLVDRKTGHLVDARGRPIDEDGYLVDPEGRRVSEDGILLDKDGSYLPPSDAAPFLDDDGAPVETPALLKAEAKAEAKPEAVAPEATPEATLEARSEPKAEAKTEPAPALV